MPIATGSANGKVVFDKVMWDGKEVRALTLTFANGKLTSMTSAVSSIDGIKATYDAAGGGKSELSWLDLGVNPATTLPLGTGPMIWGAPGSVALGFGDNRGFGGTNASDFGFSGQLGGATVTVDGAAIVRAGSLK